MSTQNVTFILRNGTASQWATANPILRAGEPGYDVDSNILKLGDGVKTWSQLFPHSPDYNANNSIDIGLYSGYVGQSINSIAIGYKAGESNQSSDAISIGNQAGGTNQGQNSIAIGKLAGLNNQAAHTIILSADGELDGVSGQAGSFYVKPVRHDGTNPNMLGYNPLTSEITFRASSGGVSFTNPIAIGTGAGLTDQNINSVAIGYNAGKTVQGPSSVAIGDNAGFTGQQSDSISIGTRAGQETQTSNSIAIGNNSGQFNQGGVYGSAIAIGNLSGLSGQQSYTIAIGDNAGCVNQGNYSIAVGSLAGLSGQQNNTIAIGAGAGQQSQSSNSIAIGSNSGIYSQGGLTGNSIAIGTYAGNANQGENSVAIGYQAGVDSQPANTIILNASDSTVNGIPGQTGSFYVSPVRYDPTNVYMVGYHPDTLEITYRSYQRYANASTISAGNYITIDTSTTGVGYINDPNLSSSSVVIVNQMFPPSGSGATSKFPFMVAIDGTQHYLIVHVSDGIPLNIGILYFSWIILSY
jgi:hypothetical protein